MRIPDSNIAWADINGPTTPLLSLQWMRNKPPSTVLKQTKIDGFCSLMENHNITTLNRNPLDIFHNHWDTGLTVMKITILFLIDIYSIIATRKKYKIWCYSSLIFMPNYKTNKEDT